MTGKAAKGIRRCRADRIGVPPDDRAGQSPAGVNGFTFRKDPLREIAQGANRVGP